MDVKMLIQQCKKQNPSAQKALYDQFSPVLFSVCKRYLKNRDEAEDALLEAMYKILTQIHKYQFKGSFEGWMRRITVNECLMKLRKNKLFVVSIDEVFNQGYDEDIISNLSYEELLNLVETLPPGYRTVFNLYVIEGYKHREIADLLGISINTSKSQLILAKRKLQDFLKKKTLTNSWI